MNDDDSQDDSVEVRYSCPNCGWEGDESEVDFFWQECDAMDKTFEMNKSDIPCDCCPKCGSEHLVLQNRKDEL